MKKSPLKRIGKIGEANQKANKIIRCIVEEKDIRFCEIRGDNCSLSWTLAPAHRHKRSYYKGDIEKLSDYNEWVIACTNCHDEIEHNKELTEKVFKRLREDDHS